MSTHRMLFSPAARRAARTLLALAALGLPWAQATTIARMSVSELTRQSSYIARVRCVSATSMADLNLVWTLNTFEVTEAWKGNPPSRFTVRLPGGDAAGIRVRVEGAPRFAVGEEAVLFLSDDRGRQMNILSWMQGTFRVRKDSRTGIEQAIQDTSGLQVLDARSGVRADGGRNRITLAALRAAVTRALQGGQQ